MGKKYYEMNVLIKGVVRTPVDDYENKACAIEYVEMTDDILDIAENIKDNNNSEFYVLVDRQSVKEVE